MDIVVKIFWKQPLSLSEVLPITDIVVNIPFGTMIVDPTLTFPVTSVNGLIGNVVLNATDVGAATEQYVQDQIASLPLSPVTSVNSKVGNVVLNATDVGAATESYVDTEITTLQTSLQTSINTKADASSVTQSLSTKADLVGGVIPANQLPSFVDDVLEYADLESFPVTGEASKIYIAIDTNKTYRWSSTQYVEIGGGGVALGETALTAYRGDRGKIAYDHSLSQGNPHNTTTSEITEGNNKYFTDLRVRNTVLSGLVKTDSSNVTNTDTVEVAVGKLAAKSEYTTTVNWIPASEVGVGATGLDISLFEFAKINGMLFCRGFIKLNSSITSSSSVFTITNNSYKVIRPIAATAELMSGSFQMYYGTSTAANLRFLVNGSSTNSEDSKTSVQRLQATTSLSINSEYFAVQQNFCFGQLVNP